MKPQPDKAGGDRNTAKRREFLKLIGLGSIAGAAVAATAGKAPAAQAEPRAENGGYRETPHVRRYYDTARF